MSWLNANEYFLMRAAVEERVEDLQATSDVVLTSRESVEGGESCEDADPEKSRAVCGVVTCGVRQGLRALEGLHAER